MNNRNGTEKFNSKIVINIFIPLLFLFIVFQNYSEINYQETINSLTRGGFANRIIVNTEMPGKNAAADAAQNPDGTVVIRMGNNQQMQDLAHELNHASSFISDDSFNLYLSTDPSNPFTGTFANYANSFHISEITSFISSFAFLPSEMESKINTDPGWLLKDWATYGKQAAQLVSIANTQVEMASQIFQSPTSLIALAVNGSTNQNGIGYRLTTSDGVVKLFVTDSSGRTYTWENGRRWVGDDNKFPDSIYQRIRALSILAKKLSDLKKHLNTMVKHRTFNRLVEKFIEKLNEQRTKLAETQIREVPKVNNSKSVFLITSGLGNPTTESPTPEVPETKTVKATIIVNTINPNDNSKTTVSTATRVYEDEIAVNPFSFNMVPNVPNYNISTVTFPDSSLSGNPFDVLDYGTISGGSWLGVSSGTLCFGEKCFKPE